MIELVPVTALAMERPRSLADTPDRITPEAATPARLLVRAKSGSVDETAAWATMGKPAAAGDESAAIVPIRHSAGTAI